MFKMTWNLRVVFETELHQMWRQYHGTRCFNECISSISMFTSMTTRRYALLQPIDSILTTKWIEAFMSLAKYSSQSHSTPCHSKQIPLSFQHRKVTQMCCVYLRYVCVVGLMDKSTQQCHCLVLLLVVFPALFALLSVEQCWNAITAWSFRACRRWRWWRRYHHHAFRHTSSTHRESRDRRGRRRRGRCPQGRQRTKDDVNFLLTETYYYATLMQYGKVNHPPEGDVAPIWMRLANCAKSKQHTGGVLSQEFQ
jgi:hypothetical protein